jgi:hypothetical protein
MKITAQAIPYVDKTRKAYPGNDIWDDIDLR